MEGCGQPGKVLTVDFTACTNSYRKYAYVSLHFAYLKPLRGHMLIFGHLSFFAPGARLPLSDRSCLSVCFHYQTSRDHA